MLKDPQNKGEMPESLREQSLEAVRQKFVAAIERLETDELKKDEGLAAVFSLKGFGQTRVRITNGRISFKGKDLGKAFTRDEAGLDKVFVSDNQSAFSRAINALDPKDVVFRTQHEEERNAIEEHLTALPARLGKVFLPNLEKRGLYDADEGTLQSTFKSSYRDKDFIHIEMQIDKDLNIILEDTSRGGNGKRAMKLNYNAEEGVYSLKTSIAVDRTIEILGEFAEKLENHDKEPLRISAVSKGEQLGQGYNSFEHDYFVTHVGTRTRSTQEARAELGLKEF